ncbi:MAG TPA: DUF4136 domain-containing protein [Terriglobales bacterium]
MRSLVVTRTQFLLCLVIMFTCVGAQPQKIKVEYDKSLDFSKFKTYAIDTVENAARPMLRLAIQAAVQDDLSKRGLTKVDANPDLYVQMYGAIDSDAIATYQDPIYGNAIPPLNYGITMWYGIPGTVTTVVVHKGELVVDVIDAARKRLIWRGIAQQKLSSDNRQKLLDQVNTSVEKMFKQYPVTKQ